MPNRNERPEIGERRARRGKEPLYYGPQCGVAATKRDKSLIMPIDLAHKGTTCSGDKIYFFKLYQMISIYDKNNSLEAI